MSDLIERQDVLDEMQICDFVRIENFAGDVRMLFADDLEKRINAIPSAQPEIIRCKDCKYYNPIGVCIEMSSAVCEDSFCCWAERRTDAIS